MDTSKYYQKVADYYDRDAGDFEERYWRNPILQRIRQSFREEVKAHDFNLILEIGCGSGLDAVHFGSIYPEKKVYAIDISPAMVAQTARKIQDGGLKNVTARIGTAESLPELFPDVKFDHIYVFFGALNTVSDLQHVALILRDRLHQDGTMVLTFVNKWYLVEMAICLLKFRFSGAFRRLRDVWGGYSDLKHLESRCLSPGDIRRAFGEHFQITSRKGYSILYPAWYRAGQAQRLGKAICDFLWHTDRLLSYTPAWCLGEYALYTFRPKI